MALQTTFKNTSRCFYLWDVRMVQYTHKLISIIHHIDKLKNRNHMIMSKDTKKALDKVQHPFMVNKSYRELRTRRNIP